MLLHMLKIAPYIRNPSTRKYITSFRQNRFLRLEPVSTTFQAQVPETFEERNERLKRPLSPHLTIYKPQLTSMLSISHRISGLALLSYALTLGLCARFSSIDQVVAFIQGLDLSYSTWLATKYVLVLPVSYHMVNGIRHLMWDCGIGLTIKGVYYTGYSVLVATVILSSFLAMY